MMVLRTTLTHKLDADEHAIVLEAHPALARGEQQHKDEVHLIRQQHKIGAPSWHDPTNDCHTLPPSGALFGGPGARALARDPGFMYM